MLPNLVGGIEVPDYSGLKDALQERLSPLMSPTNSFLPERQNSPVDYSSNITKNQTQLFPNLQFYLEHNTFSTNTKAAYQCSLHSGKLPIILFSSDIEEKMHLLVLASPKSPEQGYDIGDYPTVLNINPGK